MKDIHFVYGTHSRESVAPVAQRQPCNLLTRCDVSSIPANGIFLTKKLKNTNKNPQRVNTKFDFMVDEGKEWLNPSREKNEGTHHRKKVDEKSCVTFLLCDPGWYVQRT